MKVTSLNELEKVKQTEIVSLGKFEDGTELVAELRKPNMMKLLAEDKIPNILLNEVAKMFNGNNELAKKVTEENDAEALKQLGIMLEIFCEACLVNPTYAQIKRFDLELTQEMQISIMMYAQGGVEMLKNFRDEQERLENNQSSSQV